MQIGVVGLGKMGGNMVRRLARHGHKCVVFDQNAAAIEALVGERITGGADLAQLAAHLGKPRAVWVMLPAGEITDARSRNWARCSNRVTSSSTAATRSTRTTSGGPSSSSREASTMWIAAPPAASGESSAAIA
jgi:3-hydroxyisobutyrate dehydrogenase-like beta-hydroxyacid dehydrogenase